jgi:hypothetical protein
MALHFANFRPDLETCYAIEKLGPIATTILRKPQRGVRLWDWAVHYRTGNVRLPFSNLAGLRPGRIAFGIAKCGARL